MTRLSTVVEVASALRVSKMTVYRMLNDGTLPSYRISNVVRIPTAAVWDYLHGVAFDPRSLAKVKALP